MTKKAQWKALVLAQLNAREIHLRSGVPSEQANLMLVRNLQEYVRLHGLQEGYEILKNNLKEESHV